MPRGDSGTSRTHNQWTREQVRTYLHKDPSERPAVKEWLKDKKMTRHVFERIRGGLEIEDKLHAMELPNIKSIMERLGDEVNGVTDPTGDEAAILDDAMFREGRGGSKTAAELWYKRKGLLKEEKGPEVNVNIGAAILEIIGGGTGTGVVEVPGGAEGLIGEGGADGTRVLLPPVRDDSGQGETGDDKA